jgi:hypothetical protein
MGDYSKYKNVNTVFGGTTGVTVPNGTTAERSSSTLVGTIRYNTDLGLIEQFNALGWQAVDAPPTVTNISGIINENTSSTIQLTGSNFKNGCVAYVTGAAVGGIDRAMVTTYSTSSAISFSSNATAVNFVGGAGFGIKVSNPSGLSGTIDPAGTVDRDPLWTTGTGLVSIFDKQRGSSVSFVASDPDGTGVITYAFLSGTLPTGSTLSSAGVLSGFSAQSSDTTFTFTLRATSTNGTNVQTADRQFQVQVKAPTVTAFTANGSATFNVPTGITAVEVLVVGGGGGGGGRSGGGGGAGGLVYAPAYPVTPGGTVSLSVGAGGNGGIEAAGQQGSNSTFGVITAFGGGFGGNDSPVVGNPGGSGGGAHYNNGGGSSTQTSFPAVGATGYGNAGSNGTGAPTHNSGAGGGAGGQGPAVPTGVAGGAGGVGRQYTQFSSYGSPGGWFAGGGAGGGHPDGPTGTSTGGTGGGGTSPGSTYGNGVTNTGGGGSGCQQGVGRAGNGGPGIVLVRY